MDSENYPCPQIISIIFEGCFRPQLLRIAILLHLFDSLFDEPRSADEIAVMCRCSPRYIQYLCDYLIHLKLLERNKELYNLSSTARNFLVAGQHYYIGGWILANTNPDTWDGIMRALRSGTPSDLTIPWKQAAHLESFRMENVSQSLDIWKRAGFEVGGSSDFQIIDIACGCAIKSLALAQVDPNVHITCIDNADVLEVTLDLAKRLNVESQIKLWPEDILYVDLGKDKYDAALLGNITPYLNPEQVQELFFRVHRSLHKSGFVIINANIEDEISSEFSKLNNFIMATLWGGAAHSLEQYVLWLGKAGFEFIERLETEWMTAKKDST